MTPRKNAKKKPLMEFFGKWPEAGKITKILERDRKRLRTRKAKLG
jgi:hypothetical protein